MELFGTNGVVDADSAMSIEKPANGKRRNPIVKDPQIIEPTTDNSTVDGFIFLSFSQVRLG